jgi:hypothetical protein
LSLCLAESWCQLLRKRGKDKEDKKGAAPYHRTGRHLEEGLPKISFVFFPFFLLLSFYKKTGTIPSTTSKAAGEENARQNHSHLVAVDIIARCTRPRASGA